MTLLSTADFQCLLLPNGLFFSEFYNSPPSLCMGLASHLYALLCVRHQGDGGLVCGNGNKGVGWDPLILASARKMLSFLPVLSNSILKNKNWLRAFLTSLYCLCYLSSTLAVLMAFWDVGEPDTSFFMRSVKVKRLWTELLGGGFRNCGHLRAKNKAVGSDILNMPGDVHSNSS